VNGYIFNIGYNAPAPGSSFDGNCMEPRDPSRFIKWAGSVNVPNLAAFRALGHEQSGRMGPC
jgi:hypothetical protein